MKMMTKKVHTRIKDNVKRKKTKDMEETVEEGVDLSNLEIKSMNSSGVYLPERSIPPDNPLDKSQRRKSSNSIGVERSVSRLRPSKALVQQDAITVTDAVRRMAERRCEATLLVGNDGILSGILTDKDIAFRVVAKGLNPNTTPISQVMTPDPSCVSSSTSAMVALRTMVQGQFRHLPVADNGKVVGLLDITKCLYDAISKIERAYEASSTRFSGAIDRLERDIGRFGGANNLFQVMREKLFLPTVSSLINPELAVPKISSQATVKEAAEVMLENKCCAVMVVDDTGEANGIFTSKDLLLRTLAPGMDSSQVAVKSVMTPSPDCALLDTTILDALHLMHDGKFLHLPILDDAGRVVGLMDVLQLTYGVVQQMGRLHQSCEEDQATEPTWKTFWASMLNDVESTISANSNSGRDHYSTDSYPRENTPDVYIYKMSDTNRVKHRFTSSAESLVQLSNDVSKRLRKDVKCIGLRYLDEENDEVVLLTDDDLKDAVVAARASGRNIIHLVVHQADEMEEHQVGTSSSNPRDNVLPRYFSRLANASSATKNTSTTTSDGYVYAAAAAAAITGVAVAFFRNQR